MDVIAFGKRNCEKCEAAQSRASFVIEKTRLTDRVSVRFVDVDTVDGRAEGAFHDVCDSVPVVVVEENGRELIGWIGVPSREDLTACLKAGAEVVNHRVAL